MRRLFTALALAASLSASAVSAAPTRLDRQMDAYVQARVHLGQFNGVVLAMKGGKVVFEKAYGFADLAQRVPNRTDTRFAVASITKQFTAAAILQLRDAGKLALTDSICRFVDPCPEAWKPVTLKGLLNHTAGVPDYEEPLELGSADYTAFIGRPDNIDIILKEAATKPLDFEPGSKWHYSNTGYILLSRVIAKVSGQTYERYVEDHVLTPAGMRFSSIDDGVVTPGSAQGYAAVRELPLETLLSGVSFENLPINERSPGALAGDHGDASLWTTAEDLARWVQALEGGRIVSAASLAEMKEPGQFGYGYGLEVAKVANDRLRIRHTGGVNGFVSVVQWYPADGVTLVVLCNYENGRVSATARDLAAMIFGAPYDIPTAQVVIPPDPAGYPSLWGDYIFDGSPAKVAWDGKMLTLEVPGRFTAGMLPKADGTFYLPFLEGVARPTPDGFKIRRNGADMDLTRKPPA